MSAPLSAAEGQRVPFVVGVVGHRNPAPACIAALRQRIANVLDEMQRDYPRTPLVLLSSLAEGADQIAADVAIEKGVRVVAPLPFPADVYRNTTSFSSEDARERFDKLIQSPLLESFVVKSDAAQGEPAALAADDVARRAAYEAAGEFVVRRCQLLIALWDGIENKRVAGTAAMVKRKLTGDFSSGASDGEELADIAALGPVVHIHTARLGDETASTEAANISWLWPKVISSTGNSHEQGAASPHAKIFRRNCDLLNKFNRALQEEKNGGDETDALRRQFGERCGHSSAHLHPLALMREAAASFSRRASMDLRRGLFMLFFLIFLAATFFHIYSHLAHTNLWLVLFLVSLFGAWITVRSLKLRERRLLDYRMIAEALRVQCQWSHAGLSHDIGKHYLHQFRGEAAWIRQVLQALDLSPHDPAANFARLSEEQKLHCLKAVRESWVKGQRQFFEERFQQSHRSNHFLRSAGFTLALAGWVTAAVTFLCPKHGLLFDSVIFVSGILVVGGGLLLAYAERRLLEELARQYARMHEIFVVADERLERILAGKQISRAQALLLELGRESLTENASWLMLRRARPVEMLVH